MDFKLKFAPIYVLIALCPQLWAKKSETLFFRALFFGFNLKRFRRQGWQGWQHKTFLSICTFFQCAKFLARFKTSCGCPCTFFEHAKFLARSKSSRQVTDSEQIFNWFNWLVTVTERSHKLSCSDRQKFALTVHFGLIQAACSLIQVTTWPTESLALPALRWLVSIFLFRTLLDTFNGENWVCSKSLHFPDVLDYAFLVCKRSRWWLRFNLQFKSLELFETTVQGFCLSVCSRVNIVPIKLIQKQRGHRLVTQSTAAGSRTEWYSVWYYIGAFNLNR